MKDLINRFGSSVKGCITGFDRIVFKGMIKPLMYARGAMDFCLANGIMYKEYKNWMIKQTKALVQTADQYAKNNCGTGIMHLSTWRTRKEDLARERQLA